MNYGKIQKNTKENDIVLELGARFGSVSCIINKKLNNKMLLPINKIYIYKIHNSKQIIDFTNLEGMLYYLLTCYESNSNICIYDFIETLTKYLITDMNNYTDNEVENIDLNDEKYNVAKLLIRLSAMTYSSPYQIIFTNILLSIITDSKLHKVMKNIYKKVFDDDFDFIFNNIALYILSKKSINKYATYLKDNLYKYKPLYYISNNFYILYFVILPDINKS